MRKRGNKYARSAVSRVIDSRSQRYRECAAECERMASGVSDPSIKALDLDLAEQWRAMAEQAAILDRERPQPQEAGASVRLMLVRAPAGFKF
jgi:hypothetical protein